jgi:hypothetical protein
VSKDLRATLDIRQGGTFFIVTNKFVSDETPRSAARGELQGTECNPASAGVAAFFTATGEDGARLGRGNGAASTLKLRPSICVHAARRPRAALARGQDRGYLGRLGLSSLRLAAQDVALSRRKQGFESPRERQRFQ